MQLEIPQNLEHDHGMSKAIPPLPCQNWLCEASPLGFYGGDTNLYRFVGDDPENEVDPTGEIEIPKPVPLDESYASGYRSWKTMGFPSNIVLAVLEGKEREAYLQGFEDAKAGRAAIPPSKRDRNTEDVIANYKKYKEELLKDSSRITRLMNGINRGSIDNTWTQQEILDFYVMFITPDSSGLTQEQLAIGFQELRLLFAAINHTELGATQDRCVKFANKVTSRIGPLSVIKTRRTDWNTPYGLFPTMGPLGGFIDHRAIIVTLPKSSLEKPNRFIQFGFDDALIGGLGNKEHIFGLGDIPRSYKPLGTYDDYWFFGLFGDSDPDLKKPD